MAVEIRYQHLVAYFAFPIRWCQNTSNVGHSLLQTAKVDQDSWAAEA